jgi:hypothetical protein
MARFKIGDRITILSVVATPFAGLQGDVVEVEPQPQNIVALDRYTVVFAWGEKQTFFFMQIEPATRLSQAAVLSG